MMTRQGPHEDEHRQSARVKGDRVRFKPVGLRDLLRWASREWRLEAPVRLHDRDIADDGAPDLTPEAKRFLGFSGSDQPDDWHRVACRLDADGSFVTPMHCVVAGLPDPERAYIRDLLTDLFVPEAIAELHNIPRWVHEHVARDILGQLWDRYSSAPTPRRSKPSESQSIAEAAA